MDVTAAERTAEKAKERCETADYAKMLARMIRALGARVAEGDPEDLQTALLLEQHMAAVLRQAVNTARDEDPEGWSWGRIAAATNVTRSAAAQRWAR